MDVQYTKYFNELIEYCKLAEDDELKLESNLNFVNEMNTKLKSGHKLSSASLSKLKSSSVRFMEDSVKELRTFQKILEKIQEIRAIDESGKFKGGLMRRGVMMTLLQENARSLPLWIGLPDEKIPDLCGAIPACSNIVLSTGSRVAALVSNTSAKNASGSNVMTVDEQLELESWILAEVVECDAENDICVVEDIDFEEGKQHYSVSFEKIIPLPKWKAEPNLYPDALFKKGTHVLGLYPQTTCFYKAIVREPPTTIQEDYSLFFEDSSYPEGFAPALNIPQKYVISIDNNLKRRE